ncbi:MAG: hypothetical protein HC795_06620 [Coleofasciculaceae cyanobacterium RL_1_1]|jgi:hypothetical protein|nr:hypothetical protein [Coleofasciculaceae cyanobacterium RL_1_1]
MARKRKKLFACGHKGYGQICHRCEDERKAKESKTVEKEQKKLEKQLWKETFEGDPIDLTGLMPNLVMKARNIIHSLDSGQDYRDFGGKRLNYDRQVISIPLNRDYRMICHDVDGKPTPQSVVSHEQYNRTKPGA